MLRQIFIPIIVLVVFIFGYVKYLEMKGIYYPMKEMQFTPNDVGLQYEDIYFSTEDGLRLNAWFIPQKNSRGIILFSHGNAGNISHRLEKLILLSKMQFDLFIFDYRGYGRSSGRPSEGGIYLDTEAAFSYLVDQRNAEPTEIILYGESLGTAAIIHLAAKKIVGALIIEGGFSKGKDMAKRVYPFLPEFFFFNSYNSLERIKNINAPKLFIHSKEDEVVPMRLAQKLYSVAKSPKRFAELSGGHNTAFLDSQADYLAAIKSFIDEIR